MLHFLGEDRKHRVYGIEIRFDRVVIPRHAAKLKVVGYRKRGEDLTTFRQLRKAQRNPPVRFEVLDRGAGKDYRTCGGRRHAGRARNSAVFPAPFEPTRVTISSAAHFEGDAVKNLDAALTAFELSNGQHDFLLSHDCQDTRQ